MGGRFVVPCSDNLQLEWIKSQGLENRMWLQWEMDQFILDICPGLLLRLLVREFLNCSGSEGLNIFADNFLDFVFYIFPFWKVFFCL